MADHDRRGFWGLFGVGMAVCCGIPLLAGTGLAATLAGVGVGSWLLVATGLIVAIVGVAVNQHRRHQPQAPQEPGSAAACCTTAAPSEIAVDVADQTTEHR